MEPEPGYLTPRKETNPNRQFTDKTAHNSTRSPVVNQNARRIWESSDNGLSLVGGSGPRRTAHDDSRLVFAKQSWVSTGCIEVEASAVDWQKGFSLGMR